MLLRTSLLLIVLGAVSACAANRSTAQPTEAPSPTPTMGEAGLLPTGEQGGRQLEGQCVNGYTAPQPADPVRLDGLQILARAISGPAGTRVLPDDLEVEEMRYFEGPESPPSDREYLLNIRRWYIKASLVDNPSFAGRFLVERRTFGAGLAAVAPYDSVGFASPDWIGFQYEGEDGEPRTYEGLPGEWEGTPYDFVRGTTLDREERVFGFPGLPVEVIGCLAGT